MDEKLKAALAKIEDGESLTANDHPIASELVVPVTYTIKVKVHHWLDGAEGDGKFDTIEEAIYAWDFGLPRISAHHWDEDACHVMQDPETQKWILLYY